MGFIIGLRLPFETVQKYKGKLELQMLIRDSMCYLYWRQRDIVSCDGFDRHHSEVKTRSGRLWNEKLFGIYAYDEYDSESEEEIYTPYTSATTKLNLPLSNQTNDDGIDTNVLADRSDYVYQPGERSRNTASTPSATTSTPKGKVTFDPVKGSGLYDDHEGTKPNLKFNFCEKKEITPQKGEQAAGTVFEQVMRTLNRGE